MKRNRQLISKFKNKWGVIAVVLAILIPVLIGFVALVVDIGYVAATKNELQNIADAAALAGAGKLGDLYVNKLPVKDNLIKIKEVAQEVGTKNKAGGKHINILSNEIEIGTWDKNFVPNSTDPFVPYGGENAVRVTVRRDATANDPITTFFARIFGISTVDVRADATAALNPPIVMKINLPIGLSEWQFFDNCDPEDRNEGICSEEIRFSPTTESCAGWHNFFDPIDASAEEKKLLGFIQGNECEGDDCADVPSGEPLDGDDWLDEKFDIAEHKQPEPAETPVTTSVGSEYYFQGGTISKLFNGGRLMWEDEDGDRVVPLIDSVTGKQVVDGNAAKPAAFPALFDYFRFRDGDGDNSVWTTTAPVYKDNCPCENPNKQLTILGFTSVTVRMPNPPPDSTVTATVDCNFQVIPAKGGGGNYGNLKAWKPNLVE